MFQTKPRMERLVSEEYVAKCDSNLAFSTLYDVICVCQNSNYFNISKFSYLNLMILRMIEIIFNPILFQLCKFYQKYMQFVIASIFVIAFHFGILTHWYKQGFSSMLLLHKAHSCFFASSFGLLAAVHTLMNTTDIHFPFPGWIYSSQQFSLQC